MTGADARALIQQRIECATRRFARFAEIAGRDSPVPSSRRPRGACAPRGRRSVAEGMARSNGFLHCANDDEAGFKTSGETSGAIKRAGLILDLIRRWRQTRDRVDAADWRARAPDSPTRPPVACPSTLRTSRRETV